MPLFIQNPSGSSREKINQDNQQTKNTVGDTQPKKTPVIERQKSITNSVASNNTFALNSTSVILTDDFDDEMEEIRVAISQYEEEENHVFNKTYKKQVISEVSLISSKPTINIGLSEDELYQVLN